MSAEAGYCRSCGGTLYGDHDRCRDCREVSTGDRRSERGPEPTSRLAAVLVGAALLIGFTVFGPFLVIPFVAVLGASVGALEIVTLLALLVFGLAGPLTSGGVAGYLRGSDLRESTLTGALSGLAVGLPFGLLSSAMWVFLGTFATPSTAAGDSSIGLFYASLAVGIFFQVGLLAAVCGAGGAIGAKLTDRRAPGT